MRTTYLILAFITPLAIMISCESDKVGQTNPECPETVSYSARIEPMILTNCSTSGCHNAAGPGKPALTNHAEISANASVIRNVIRKNPGEPNFMPIGGPKLADSIIQEFGCWIEQGLQNN